MGSGRFSPWTIWEKKPIKRRVTIWTRLRRNSTASGRRRRRSARLRGEVVQDVRNSAKNGKVASSDAEPADKLPAVILFLLEGLDDEGPRCGGACHYEERIEDRFLLGGHDFGLFGLAHGRRDKRGWKNGINAKVVYSHRLKIL